MNTNLTVTKDGIDWTPSYYTHRKVNFLEALILSICEQWDKTSGKSADFIELGTKTYSKLIELDPDNSHLQKDCARSALNLIEYKVIDKYCRFTSFGREVLKESKVYYPHAFE